MNVRKQLVKAPKLHFFDTGLACSLLGIRSPADLANHPLRGALFETWVVAEIHKGWTHAGREPRLRHLRATRGPEVDVMVEDGTTVHAVECKAGATLASEWLDKAAGAAAWLASAGGFTRVVPIVVYGGARSREGERRAIAWRRLGEEPWAEPPPSLA